MKAGKEAILAAYEEALERIRTLHVKRFPGYENPVFLISNAYPGVWLEHTYDAVAYAQLEPSMAHVAKAQCELFLDGQKPDGHLPYRVMDSSNPNSKNYGSAVGYGQLQECVSFASLCLDTYWLTKDIAFLRKAYRGCSAWDSWLRTHRNTLGTGLVELFCEFDSGHDNSPRFADIAKKGCPGADAANCNPEPFLPLLSPDINAVAFGSRMALFRMASLLGLEAESGEWRELASALREKLIATCYDPRDGFFYDVDREGRFRRFKSIHIANLFQEHLLEKPLSEEIYERFLRNPKEFWTPYPFASLSASDPRFVQERDGNDWGFFSQGLTSLRALRWMDFYGKGRDLETLMDLWVERIALSSNKRFTQELHPLTGEPSSASEWYSSVMLFYLHAVRRLGYVS